MPSAPLPSNETDRLKALYNYQILDTEFEPAYDEITEVVAYICQVPTALISLVDKDRQWFKAMLGMDSRETPRDVAFCAYALHDPYQLLVVEDATQDQRFNDNPLVLNEPGIRFYAGAPLITPNGYCLGTLCALDYQPRQLQPEQLKALDILSRQVIIELELRDSLKQIKNYANNLHQLNANKDHFFATLAHDLRSPCGGILGMAEILKEEVDALSQAEIKEYAQDIYDSATEVHELMNSLLQWSMFETGGMVYKPGLVSLSELTRSVISLLNASAQKKQIALEIATQEDITIFADRQMLYSVFQNLVSNALKFTPSGGKITIAWTIADNTVQIQVRDTGIGMTLEQLEQILFEASIRSTEGTDGEAGTGLGLLLCRQFISKHGGKLGVVSRPNSGTTFLITLPYPAIGG